MPAGLLPEDCRWLKILVDVLVSSGNPYAGLVAQAIRPVLCCGECGSLLGGDSWSDAPDPMPARAGHIPFSPDELRGYRWGLEKAVSIATQEGRALPCCQRTVDTVVRDIRKWGDLEPRPEPNA